MPTRTAGSRITCNPRVLVHGIVVVILRIHPTIALVRRVIVVILRIRLWVTLRIAPTITLVRRIVVVILRISPKAVTHIHQPENIRQNLLIVPEQCRSHPNYRVKDTLSRTHCLRPTIQLRSPIGLLEEHTMFETGRSCRMKFYVRRSADQLT